MLQEHTPFQLNPEFDNQDTTRKTHQSTLSISNHIALANTKCLIHPRLRILHKSRIFHQVIFSTSSRMLEFYKESHPHLKPENQGTSHMFHLQLFSN